MTDLAARIRSARRHPGSAVLEGFHAVKHAIRFGADLVELVTPDPEALAEMADRLAPDITGALAEAAVVPLPEFADLAPRPIPTALLAVARRPAVDAGTLLVAEDPSPVVLLERPRHHGNVGAAIRVAAAAGAAGVVTTGDLDPWDPAALRGSAGLHFAVPVARLDGPPRTDRPLVALDPTGSALRAGSLPDRAIVAFGSERSGISEELASRSVRRVAIPMRPGVSSLNLATAVAVVLYCGEWRAPAGAD